MAKPQPQGSGNVPVHPVLAQLRSTFGMDSEEAKTYTSNIGGMNFTLQLVNGDRLAAATKLAESVDMSVAEFTIKMRRSIAAAAIFKVENVLLEDILDIPFNKLGKMLSKKERRQQAISTMYTMIMGEEGKWMELGDEIYNAYQVHLEPYSSITHSTSADHNQMQYQCPVTDCTETFKAAAAGKYFCRVHGAELKLVNTLETERNIPLE
jgi:hypothetical protein